MGTEEVVFSFGAGWQGDIPPPFRVAANAVRLVACDAPCVLILGFGLGAMARLILEQRPAARIVGVEPDAELFSRAQQEFRRAPSVPALLRLPAQSYLGRRRRQRFDLVIDDCYEMIDGEPRRPAGMNQSGSRVVGLLNSQDSILVRNLLTDDGPVHEQTADLQSHFPYLLQRSFRDWENVLVLAKRTPFEPDARRSLRWR